MCHRTARVKLDNSLSYVIKVREGIPQRGVVSPTLFVVFINGITVNPTHLQNSPCRWLLQCGILLSPAQPLPSECRRRLTTLASEHQSGVPLSTAKRQWPPASFSPISKRSSTSPSTNSQSLKKKHLHTTASNSRKNKQTKTNKN